MCIANATPCSNTDAPVILKTDAHISMPFIIPELSAPQINIWGRRWCNLCVFVYIYVYLDFGFWILDIGFWILDIGFWILDFGMLDFGVWVLDV